MIFFRFIRWLMFLNLFLTLLWICVIIIPFFVQGPSSFKDSVVTATNESVAEIVNSNSSYFYGLAANCTAEYSTYSDTIFQQESTFEKVLDFLQGTVSFILMFVHNDLTLDLLESLYLLVPYWCSHQRGL